MCYHVAFTIAGKQLSDYFPDLCFDEQMDISFDRDHIPGHAYYPHPIIYRNREDGQLHCRTMEWGLIPYYVTDQAAFARQRATMLNARSERILGDPKSYWYKIRNRRCLIPLTGTYEYRGVKGWKKKVPYFVKPADQDLFFLPGLYSVANLVDKETGEVNQLWTYTMITRAANSLMTMIHNSGENRGRMPLFLPFELSKKWIEDDLSTEAYQVMLDYEMPADGLEYHTVFTLTGTKGREDDQPKNIPWNWEKLPPLGEADPD